MFNLANQKRHSWKILNTLFFLVLFPWPQSTRAEGIEISKTLVRGDPRVIGLGGAYTSVAEGLAGLAFNPASMGNRSASDTDWWAWDAIFGLSLHPLRNTDYENDGFTNDQIERQRTIYMGLAAQINSIGIGWTRSTRHYSVPVNYPTHGTHETEFTFFEHALAIGVDFKDSGLAIGSTVFIESTEISLTSLDGFFGGLPTGLLNSTIAEARMSGNGPGGMSGLEVGVLYRVQNEPFRLGATLRTAFNQTTAALKNEATFNEFRISRPRIVRSPSYLRLGASYQWGAPYNPSPRWKPISLFEIARQSPRDHSPLQEPQPSPIELEPLTQYLLLSGDLIVMPGYLSNQVQFRGPEGFSLNRNEKAGESWTLGFHSGIETAPIPGWMRLRVGNYYEPSRFEGVDGRFHLTAGIDMMLPHLWLLRTMNVANWVTDTLSRPLMAQVYLDVSRNYLSIGFSVGIWR